MKKIEFIKRIHINFHKSEKKCNQSFLCNEKHCFNFVNIYNGKINIRQKPRCIMYRINILDWFMNQGTFYLDRTNCRLSKEFGYFFEFFKFFKIESTSEYRVIFSKCNSSGNLNFIPCEWWNFFVLLVKLFPIYFLWWIFKLHNDHSHFNLPKKEKWIQ